MIGDGLENVPQISFRIEAVQLRCTGQRVNRRGPLATTVGAEGQEVLATHKPRSILS